MISTFLELDFLGSGLFLGIGICAKLSLLLFGSKKSVILWFVKVLVFLCISSMPWVFDGFYDLLDSQLYELSDI